MTSIPKQTALGLIQNLIDTISGLQQLKAGCGEFLRWRRDTETALLKMFPDDQRHLQDLNGIRFFDRGPMFAVAGPNTPSAPLNHQPVYLRGLGNAKILLESIVAEIGTYWPDTPAAVDIDFWSLIHPDIKTVSKGRFDAGEYADCAEAAFKHINSVVKEIYKKKTSKELDGSDLMKQAFTPNNPVIVIDDISTLSGKSVQQGYMEIFSGVMTGIRNPKAHANIRISKERAIHFLFVASTLMDTLDIAHNKYRF